MYSYASWATYASWVGAAVAALLLSTSGDARAQTSANDLQYRLSVIDAELADIRARVGGTGTVSTGTVTSGGGAMLVRLDQLEAELRRLTGQIEELSFRQRQIAEEAARRFSDVEFRLTELEGGDVAILQPIPPLGSPRETPTPTLAISEQGELDRAIEDVNQGRYDQGEDRLRSFLNAYPGTSLRAEAHYWLGESQFARGDFQNAARSYLSGYNEDRSVPIGPRNLYKLGVTLGRLGQRNEACLTLNEVRIQFPNGPADILGAAADESRNLNCA